MVTILGVQCYNCCRFWCWDIDDPNYCPACDLKAESDWRFTLRRVQGV